MSSIFRLQKSPRSYQQPYSEGCAQHTGDVFALAVWFESWLRSRDAVRRVPDELSTALARYEQYIVALGDSPSGGGGKGEGGNEQ